MVSRVSGEQRDQAALFLDRSHFSVAGVTDSSLYRALCNNPRVYVAVATTLTGAVVGALAVQLRKTWIVRHPLLLVRAVAAKLAARWAPGRPQTPDENHASQRAPVLPPYVERSPSPIAWSGEYPRVLFISTDPEWRGKGIAALLYDRMSKDLQAAGYGAVLARIAYENAASLSMHRKTGWQLYDDLSAVTAVKVLSSR